MARLQAALALGLLLGLCSVLARAVEQQSSLHADADLSAGAAGSLEGYTREAQADFVPELPGAPPNQLKIFSGWVDIRG